MTLKLTLIFFIINFCFTTLKSQINLIYILWLLILFIIFLFMLHYIYFFIFIVKIVLYYFLVVKINLLSIHNQKIISDNFTLNVLIFSTLLSHPVLKDELYALNFLFLHQLLPFFTYNDQLFIKDVMFFYYLVYDTYQMIVFFSFYYPMLIF